LDGDGGNRACTNDVGDACLFIARCGLRQIVAYCAIVFPISSGTFARAERVRWSPQVPALQNIKVIVAHPVPGMQQLLPEFMPMQFT
jgi:hypothetical protein